MASRDPRKFQHQGFGQLLMEEAARIALHEHASYKLAVISGVGTRDYYRKLGYELDGPYMSRTLRHDKCPVLATSTNNASVQHVTLDRVLNNVGPIFRS